MKLISTTGPIAFVICGVGLAVVGVGLVVVGFGLAIVVLLTFATVAVVVLRIFALVVNVVMHGKIILDVVSVGTVVEGVLQTFMGLTEF